MKLLFSTGWAELGNYWGDWFISKQIGGSENMLMEIAVELSGLGHEVTVRLPYAHVPSVFRGVRWVGLDHPALRGDVLFCFDDFAKRDDGARTLLVATRSDPPKHCDFDELIFYSKTHAKLMGHPTRPAIGGGVRLSEYEGSLERIPRRVICTGSPDRVPAATAIGRDFDFVHTYRPVPGMPPTTEYSRAEVVALQRTAQVMIHPCDPVRPAEFFSMAVLESMAAGTPCIISDADALPEIWSSAAVVLKRPIDLSEWSEYVESFMEDPALWQEFSDAGKDLARQYDWSVVAPKFLEVACGN